MHRLSTKQRRFAAGIATGLSVADAAAQAGYSHSHKWRAEKNMLNEEVLHLIAYLRQGIAARDEPGAVAADATVEDGATREAVVRMLLADRRLAYREGAPGAAVSATVAIARVNGLIVDRKQVEVGPLREMSDTELLRHLEGLAREGRRLVKRDAIDVKPSQAGGASEPPTA